MLLFRYLVNVDVYVFLYIIFISKTVFIGIILLKI